jgi:hypothetical protein
MKKRQRKKAYKKLVAWWIRNSDRFSDEIIQYHPINILS